MKYLAPARRIACVVILVLGAFGAERMPADAARMTAAGAEQTNAASAYPNVGSAIEPIAVASPEFSPPLLRAELMPAPATSVKSPSGRYEAAATAATPNPIVPAKPIVVALAEANSPAAIRAPQAPVAPTLASSQWPAPARFFTINQVLAKRQQASSGLPATHLAAIDPKIMSDASAAPASPARSDEPFGLFTFRAPDGLLWSKWRGVEADIRAEAPALARCQAEPGHCTPATARFVAIVKQAEARQGRAKLELVNERVNAAIHYKTDMAQWGTADLWSAPLDANGKGSFDTGFGDCEDYAIAKYVALREAGIPAENLRLLLVRDNVVRMDHAVLAARADGRWLILDNRYSALTEERDARFLTPLFALGDDGVKLFAAPYAAGSAPKDQNGAAPAANGEDFIAGQDLADGDLSATLLLL